MFPEPRAFQKDTIDDVRQAMREGHKNVMIMAPTGGGKTYIGLKIIESAIQKGKRATFLCDRKTLINQTSETADRYGLSAHGIIQANHWRRNMSHKFQIASAQTIAKRGFFNDTDLLIVDEAHTQLKVWTEFAQKSTIPVIGLSATPFSKGLGKIFTKLVNATTMRDLTEKEVLVPLKIFSCTQIDMTGAKTANGEWTDNASGERGMQIVGDVVSEWIKFGQNRKTICFGANIKHCLELCKQCNDAGIFSATFTSKTTDAERQELLAEYTKKDSELKVLISVEALAKGFDVPDVSCVIDCRPLRKSLSTFIQMVGRGLRSSPRKKDCILLDHSGNIVRFMTDFELIFSEGLSELDLGEKLDNEVRKDKEKKEVAKCPRCGFSPFSMRCMACGHEKKIESEIEVSAGEMRQITLNGQVMAQDSQDLWNQICSYTKSVGRAETAKGRAWHLYKGIMGSVPRHLKFENSTEVYVSPATHRKIKQINIAFAKRKTK